MLMTSYHTKSCIGYRSLMGFILPQNMVAELCGVASGYEVRLEGWQQFRGGLDTKSKFQILFLTARSHILDFHTGNLISKFTRLFISSYEGHEIMFHVSTLLPYSQENKQLNRYDELKELNNVSLDLCPLHLSPLSLSNSCVYEREREREEKASHW